MRRYPSSFFIQLSNMYCTPTTALRLYLQPELTQREKYAILIIEDLFQGEVQFLTGGEKHWLQVRAPAIVSKAEWVGIPYQRYSPDERNKIRLYSRVYFGP